MKAELAGFKTITRTGITLTIGREAVVNFALELGELSEEVVVTGDAPMINTTSSTMQALVGEEVIKNLPLNARDFVQLATLQSGVQQVGALEQGNPARRTQRGQGTLLAISGARPYQNAFTLDDFVMVKQLARTGADQTVAMAIYGAARTAPSPAVNAIGTLMLVASTVVITLAYVVYRRSVRRQGPPERGSQS